LYLQVSLMLNRTRYSLTPFGVPFAPIALRRRANALMACSALLLFHGTPSWSGADGDPANGGAVIAAAERSGVGRSIAPDRVGEEPKNDEANRGGNGDEAPPETGDHARRWPGRPKVSQWRRLAPSYAGKWVMTV
jgi:hypothetical protein